MKLFWKTLPWLFVALFGAEIVAVILPKHDGEFHVREFARLPVLLNGRVQPFDSVAHNSLLEMRSTGDVPLEIVPSWKFWHHPKKLRATEWLLEVMLRPEQADERPVFLVHHPELIGELKLENKGIEKSGLRYYTFSELTPALPEISRQAEPILKREEEKIATPEERTVLEKQLLKLYNSVVLYRRLKNTIQPESADDFAGELNKFQKAIGPVAVAVRAQSDGKGADEDAMHRLIEPVRKPLTDFQMMARMAYPLIVPPLNPEVSRDDWKNAGASLLDTLRTGELHPAMKFFSAMATAYRHDRPPNSTAPWPITGSGWARSSNRN